MDVDTLRALFEYNRWVNNNLFDLAEQLTPAQTHDSYGASFDTIHGTLAHMLGGEVVWFNRLAGQTAVPGNAEQMPDIKAIRARWNEHQERIDALLSAVTTEQLRSTLRWTARDGGTYEAPTWQTLMQVINHSTHHRAELCDMLTRAGSPPPVTDFIAYYMQKVG